jgi:thioredoxin
VAVDMDKKMFLEKVFNYEEKQTWEYQDNVPCLIDFWAPWCGPCLAVAPLIDELSKEYKGKVNFYKVNTDIEQELSEIFGIRSIPALLFIPLEGQPKMSVGALPKDILKQAIEKELLTMPA